MTSQTHPITQTHPAQSRFRPSAPLRNSTTGLLGTSALLVTLLAGLFAMLSLSACGGGSMGSAGAASAPAAGKVTVAGTLAGTSTAIQFNQQPVNAASAAITVNGRTATSASLQPGVVFVGKGTHDSHGINLQSADVIQELKGPITTLDQTAATLVVLGSTVTVNALTHLEQEGSDHSFSTLTLADFAVGDVVSVFGTRQADGSILATRIEREASNAPGEVELRGAVATLDTTAMTFNLGSVLVNYSGAQVDGTLAEGTKVEVEGNLTGTTLMATRVHVENGMGHDMEKEAEFSGSISNLDTTAKTFSLLSFTVDYSGATVEGTLVAGATVEVEGAMSATDPNTLVAVKVEVRFPRMGNGASDTKAKGPITALNATDLTLTVGGVTYWTDAQTLITADDAPGTFAQLQVGDPVEVKALSTHANAAGQPYATRIEKE